MNSLHVRGVLLLLATPLCACAQTSFADLSLEQLLAVPVVSAAKKASTLGETAAAVTRLSGDDILGDGALSLADALRAVPGAHVAQLTSSSWAVTVRGFNGEYVNKLLVLIDGRPVYSTTFGGVFWSEQDLILADLESIEVIRGPGGTLWGANAMNGVINITTKPARDTQGGLVSVDYGNELDPSVSLRQGGQVSENVHYRVWFKNRDADELRLPSGSPAADGSRDQRGGARVDWERDPQTDLTLEAQAFTGSQDWITPKALPILPGTTIPDSIDYAGGSVRARVVHRQTPDARLEAQASCSLSRHDTPGYTIDDRTTDLGIQQQFKVGERHDFVVGLGASHTDNTMIAGLASISPPTSCETVWSAFAQDEIALADSLRFTLGTKVEHNDVTGVEWQPSARLLWRATSSQSYWASISRAVRTPSRLNLATYTAPGLGGPASGNPIDLVSEEVLATEIGARVELSRRLSLDASFFFNRYQDVATATFLGPFFDPLTGPYFQLVMENNLAADSYGGEIALSYRPLDEWRLRGSLSTIEVDATGGGASGLGRSPRYIARLDSTVKLGARWQWSQILQYTGEISSYDLPAYLRLDTGVNWAITDRLSAGLWLYNALDPVHPEYVSDALPTLEIPRSVVARLTFTF